MNGIKGLDSSTRLTLIVCALLSLSSPAPAQAFSVIHSFGPSTGSKPHSGVTIDAHGNLYGTTFFGGQNANGVVYKLSRHGSSWIYSVLHEFTGSDGAQPVAKPLIAPNGTLYDTATAGGMFQDGTLVNLRPQPNRCSSISCPWQATVIHSFALSSDGSSPVGINFDPAGDIIGATLAGGGKSEGTIFKLTPSQGSWTFSLLTDFSGSNAGDAYGGVISDSQGNIYGAGYYELPGSIFEITSSGQLEVLYQFPFSGANGVGLDYGLVQDQAGNLYGMAAGGGQLGGGTVYELSPSGGSWSLAVLHNFPSFVLGAATGSASLTLDAEGNLYGTTFANGTFGLGNVFKLTPSSGGWTYTDLYDFTGEADGCLPWSDVVMDASGNLYGTTEQCGSSGAGTVWEITP